ncbi:MAG: hypothetical protein ACOC1V_02320, partial [Candidatus Saliniplasma sp.]
MEFELEAVLSFSGEIDGIKDDISKVISEANKDILKRGIPKGVESGGASVVGYSTEGKVLHVKIVSDRYVRAHDAVVRLRKKLSEEMGKKHHVGVRDIKIERYQISFKLEDEPKKQIDLPYVDNIKIEGKNCEVSVSSLTEEQLQKNFVDRIINRIKEKVHHQHYEGKEEKWELVWESEKKDI